MKYFVIYKPYGILSQFTPEGKWEGLGTLASFPKDVYPVGRLDVESEGLLILTDDKQLNHKLLDPHFEHKRAYLVQVDREITDEAIVELRQGVEIKVRKKPYLTLPSICERIDSPEWLPERDPPIRFRKNVPTSWIALTLVEGKNRQVRKMTAKVGYPTLRLVRYAIEGLTIDGMKPGEVKEVTQGALIEKLGL